MKFKNLIKEEPSSNAIADIIRSSKTTSIDKHVASRYADLIIKDSTHMRGEQLQKRIISRLQDIIDSDKEITKIFNMIKDEL